MLIMQTTALYWKMLFLVFSIFLPCIVVIYKYFTLLHWSCDSVLLYYCITVYSTLALCNDSNLPFFSSRMWDQESGESRIFIDWRQKLSNPMYSLSACVSIIYFFWWHECVGLVSTIDGYWCRPAIYDTISSDAHYRQLEIIVVINGL